DAVVELGEGAEGDGHDVVSFEELAGPVPAMSRGRRPQKGAADTASVRAAEAQRRTSEAGEFGAALTPRPRGGRLVRPGKLFRRRGWRRRLRDLALGETCRDGLAERQRKGPPGSFPELSTQRPANGEIGALCPRAASPGPPARRGPDLEADQSRR